MAKVEPKGAVHWIDHYVVGTNNLPAWSFWANQATGLPIRPINGLTTNMRKKNTPIFCFMWWDDESCRIGAFLQPENHWLRPFVERKQYGPLRRSPERLRFAHGFQPLAPVRRRGRIPRAREQILSIEENARVDVPGDAECRVVDDVRRPDTGKEVVPRHW